MQLSPTCTRFLDAVRRGWPAPDPRIGSVTVVAPLIVTDRLQVFEATKPRLHAREPLMTSKINPNIVRAALLEVSSHKGNWVHVPVTTALPSGAPSPKSSDGTHFALARDEVEDWVRTLLPAQTIKPIDGTLGEGQR